jgi:hypothetical protein
MSTITHLACRPQYTRLPSSCVQTTSCLVQRVNDRVLSEQPPPTDPSRQPLIRGKPLKLAVTTNEWALTVYDPFKIDSLNARCLH